MTFKSSDLSEKLKKALQQDKKKEIEVGLPVDRLIIFNETVLVGSLAIATGIVLLKGRLNFLEFQQARLILLNKKGSI